MNTTELAQREKFEAWAEHACAAPWGYLKKRRTTEGYSEQIYTCMWTAWKVASAELVESLEKAQTINAAAEKLVRCKGRYHSEQNYRALAALFAVTTPDLPPLEHENVHYADAAEMEIAARRCAGAELESFRIAYMEWSDKTDWVQTDKRFGVVKPLGKHRADVLKEYIQHLESRTVTVKLPDYADNGVGETWDDGFNSGIDSTCDAFRSALTAAGIKWEAE